MSETLDVLSFINEIKKNPCLWDSTSGHKFDKIKKMAAWGNVARSFICDFEKLDEQVKDEIYQKLSSKWRNIRDSYVRHRKKKYGRRGYIHASSLTFLDVNFDQNSIDTDHTEDISDSENTLLDGIKFIQAGRSDKSHLEFESDNWPSDEEPLVSMREHTAKKVKCEETTEHVDIEPLGVANPIILSTDDDNKSFFESLLPTVRDFGIDEKLVFRSEVLKLIQKIRNSR